jgi:hypothetical protein
MSEQPDAAPLEHPYEPPRVEVILTGEELAREIHYAGVGGSEPFG